MSAIMRRILSTLLLQQTVFLQEAQIARDKPFGDACGPGDLGHAEGTAKHRIAQNLSSLLSLEQFYEHA
jgi:hypothetical protein